MNNTKDFSFLVKCFRYEYNNNTDTPSTESWVFTDSDRKVHAYIEVPAGSDFILNKYYILTVTPIVNKGKVLVKKDNAKSIDNSEDIYELSEAISHPGYLNEDIDEICYTLRNFANKSEIVINTTSEDESLIISNKQGYTIKISEANFVNL